MKLYYDLQIIATAPGVDPDSVDLEYALRYYAGAEKFYRDYYNPEIAYVELNGQRYYLSSFRIRADDWEPPQIPKPLRRKVKEAE
jgi:hypothetical protein